MIGMPADCRVGIKRAAWPSPPRGSLEVGGGFNLAKRASAPRQAASATAAAATAATADASPEAAAAAAAPAAAAPAPAAAAPAATATTAAAAATATAAAHELNAGGDRSLLVEHIERRQADVGDFFFTEREFMTRLDMPRRDIRCRASRLRGYSAAGQRQ